jgi:hypothetical protein
MVLSKKAPSDSCSGGFALHNESDISWTTFQLRGDILKSSKMRPGVAEGAFFRITALECNAPRVLLFPGGEGLPSDPSDHAVSRLSRTD